MSFFILLYCDWSIFKEINFSGAILPESCKESYFQSKLGIHYGLSRLLFLTYQCLQDRVIPVFSHCQQNRSHIVAYVR